MSRGRVGFESLNLSYVQNRNETMPYLNSRQLVKVNFNKIHAECICVDLCSNSIQSIHYNA
jgi:hypothetical protein